MVFLFEDLSSYLVEIPPEKSLFSVVFMRSETVNAYLLRIKYSIVLLHFKQKHQSVHVGRSPVWLCHCNNLCCSLAILYGLAELTGVVWKIESFNVLVQSTIFPGVL